MNSRVLGGGEKQGNHDCFPACNTTKIIQIRIKDSLLIQIIFHYDKKFLSLVQKNDVLFSGDMI